MNEQVIDAMSGQSTRMGGMLFREWMEARLAYHDALVALVAVTGWSWSYAENVLVWQYVGSGFGSMTELAWHMVELAKRDVLMGMAENESSMGAAFTDEELRRVSAPVVVDEQLIDAWYVFETEVGDEERQGGRTECRAVDPVGGEIGDGEEKDR